MTSTLVSSEAGRSLANTTNQRSQFTRVLKECIRCCQIDVSGRVLIVGGSAIDVSVLRAVGFRQLTLSNIDSVRLSADDIPGGEDLSVEVTSADVENLHFGDDSYDVVIAHEVLHHCRSPHAGLLDMLRVSRGHVIVMEPHDSLFMKILGRMRLATFPYELAAVIDHNYQSGGVRDSCIPNFVYRWNRNEVFKTASSFTPDRAFELYAHPYWDLNLDARALSFRKQTRLHIFTSVLGTTGFLRSLRVLQKILNFTPILRRQGNKFFCCIEKRGELRPWLVHDNVQGIVFNRRFGKEEANA